MAVNQECLPVSINQLEAAVDVRDVFKIYKESGVETVALRGVSLQVKAGEFVAVMGPSGSGKSTLLNLIGGMDTPSAGQVWINGRDILALTETQRSHLRQNSIGFMFQNNNLLPFLTALENVMLPMQLAAKPTAHHHAVELLQAMGLGERLQHRPGMLSGGEQQRVGIACALANEPALLLVDEPTGELDSATGHDIMMTLVNLHENRCVSIILVTHDPETAAFADRTISMRDGLIIGGQS